MPFLAAGLGFFHTWWAGILSFALAIVASVIAERTSIASPFIERYLALLVEHLNRRRADFKKAGDSEREAAASELLERLTELWALNAESHVHAPTVTVAQKAPFGDRHFLLRQASTSRLSGRDI